MAYYTEDFIKWKHKKIEPYTVGYAPTVVKNNGRFLLIASESDLYESNNPLGLWEYMKTSPFLLTTEGLVTGTGHGSIVDGPNGNTYVFYTCNVGYGGMYERRIGYDLLEFNENGDIKPLKATQTPNFAPGVSIKGSANLINLTKRMSCKASSYIEGRDEMYAFDNSMITWWQPEISDTLPTLTVLLAKEPVEISTARII